AQAMFENKYGCLPVVEGRHLVGILTEADFVRFLAEGH
ncbi:MAG: CBS domain-containing protein, partial [Acidobacteria bacterium]|nr:CBS domain-containing protein [Acidobacteriota bacterium]